MDIEKLQAELDKDLEMLRARDFWGALALISCAVFFLWRTSFIRREPRRGERGRVVQLRRDRSLWNLAGHAFARIGTAAHSDQSRRR